MNAFRNLIPLVVCVIFSTSACAITDAEVFAYAEANYRSLFSGTVTAGQYQQYDYRYYADTKNYLAVDNTATIFILGPVSGGVIQAVGTVASFAPFITAWQATQFDQFYGTFSGNWDATSGGRGPFSVTFAKNASAPTKIDVQATSQGAVFLGNFNIQGTLTVDGSGNISGVLPYPVGTISGKIGANGSVDAKIGLDNFAYETYLTGSLSAGKLPGAMLTPQKGMPRPSGASTCRVPSCYSGNFTLTKQ